MKKKMEILKSYLNYIKNNLLENVFKIVSLYEDVMIQSPLSLSSIKK